MGPIQVPTPRAHTLKGINKNKTQGKHGISFYGGEKTKETHGKHCTPGISLFSDTQNQVSLRKNMVFLVFLGFGEIQWVCARGVGL
mgnify:CR=1 FL=1